MTTITTTTEGLRIRADGTIYDIWRGGVAVSASSAPRLIARRAAIRAEVRAAYIAAHPIVVAPTLLFSPLTQEPALTLLSRPVTPYRHAVQIYCGERGDEARVWVSSMDAVPPDLCGWKVADASDPHYGDLTGGSDWIDVEDDADDAADDAAAAIGGAA